jgi:D-serine deaminase-like pyridoxal phosphate-dependent protein
MTATRPWYFVENVDEIESPALLIYPDRVASNLDRMIAIAGGARRLRPHVKTHKLPQIVEDHLQAGIGRFKCSTIAEAEMLARSGAADVLLAYQPVGPNIARLLRLAAEWRDTRFSALVDDEDVVDVLDRAAADHGIRLELFLDVDVGMHRTGVAPDGRALEVYRRLCRARSLEPRGLHAYDGHIRDSDPAARAAACDAAFDGLSALRERLLAEKLPVPAVVAGGTPTFPVHARRGDVELSPGTCVLWDAGYSTMLPDLDFLHAALVLTRVVSTPGHDRVCLDLGHKAIASENPHPRVVLLDLPEAVAVGHSEEHLVVTLPAARPAPGTPVYGVPWHICPTVALHAEAVIVCDAKAIDRWRVIGRERHLTV